MGSGAWNPSGWSAYAAKTAATKATVDDIYTSTHMHEDLDPKKVAVRESRDTDGKEPSTAICVFLDVTGSMSRVLDHVARKALGTMVGEIYDRKPVTDPHILIGAIGDTEYDRSPLQVTQFETEVAPMTAQLEKIWLERGGGGNHYESYTLAWLFAAMHTSTDCFEKRGKKGYLFTIGDEEPTPVLYKAKVDKVLNAPLQADLTARQLLDMVSRSYEVYHVIIEEGSDGMRPEVHQKWADLLGQRALHLSDHKMLAELIVSAIEINEGRDRAAVIKSWGGSTALVVAKGTSGLTATTKDSAGVVTL